MTLCRLIFPLFLTLPASAGVVRIPSSVAPSLAVPILTSGLPENPLSLPVDLPSSPSLTPSLIPTLAAPSFPEAPELPQAVRALNNFWDGLSIEAPELEEPPSAAVPLAAAADGPIDDAPERLAPWLATPDPKMAAALDRAVLLARATRAGRRALDAAEKTLFSEGRSLSVDVLDLGRNHGEYDYLERSMRLHSKLFKKGREAELAGTLVHELIHVVQHGDGIPSNALEMELEAHLQDLEMLSELGIVPPKGTFARQAYDRLAKSPAAFVELIQAAVPGTIFLGESSLEEILDQLEEDLAAQRKRSSKSAAALAKVIERDIARLRTAEGEASYRAFSKRVRSLLRRRSAGAR